MISLLIFADSFKQLTLFLLVERENFHLKKKICNITINCLPPWEMVFSYACESPYIYIHLLGQCVLRSFPKNSKLCITYWVTNTWEIWVTEMIFPQWHSKSPDSQHLAEITTWYFSYFTVSSFHSTIQLNSEKFICYSKTTYLLPESILM